MQKLTMRKEKINKFINKIKKKQSVFLPFTHKTLHFTCFLLLCNAIIRVNYIKVVEFKRKLHYIIRGREFFPT